MRLGTFDIRSIESGHFKLDGGAMFGVVPKVLWERTNPADAKNRIDMSMRLVVIRQTAGPDAGRVIVVDTGIGKHWDQKSTDIYAIDHSRADLFPALASIGVKPAEVTDVVITHLHFDHVGGAMYWEGDTPKAAFPNARYYVQEENQHHAHQPTEKDRASFIEHTFRPLEETGKLVKLSGPKTILPGVDVLVTHGHTPGQQLLKVSDGRQTVLFCGDTIATSSHIPIPYVMGYDLYPLMVMEEKRKILDQAIQENWILAWSHDPFVAANRVAYEKGKFKKGEAVVL